VNTLERSLAPALALNEIGRCELTLAEPVPFDAYGENREMGAFILIDRVTNATLAAGMICAPGGTTGRDHWNEAPHGVLHQSTSPVTLRERGSASVSAQSALLTWSVEVGKTAIANAVERKLFTPTVAAVLDGHFRLGMSRDSASPRVSGPGRPPRGRTAKISTTPGICLTLSSPHEVLRERAREAISDDRFLSLPEGRSRC
jgi:bifunctional enzyme CysN/CysC